MQSHKVEIYECKCDVSFYTVSALTSRSFARFVIIRNPSHCSRLSESHLNVGVTSTLAADGRDRSVSR